MPPTERLWIATAPAGVVSSGPSVIYDEGTADPILDQYREMGWEVVGPYVLEPVATEANDQHTRRLAAMVERSHERMRRQMAERELSQDACAGCYPMVTESGPCVCFDEPEDFMPPLRGMDRLHRSELSKEPPDASDGEGGAWPTGAPGEFYEPFPEPSPTQVAEAERKLREHGNGSEERWEGEGGASPSNP